MKTKIKRVYVFLSVGVLSLAFILSSFAVFKHSYANNTGELPKGWIKAGDKPDSYDMGLEKTTYHTGKACAYIKSNENKINGFGTLMQMADPKEYLGKRVRLTCWVKSVDVKDWAGVWFRIDGKDGSTMLGFDNMQNRPIKGTTEWKKYEIVLDVPENSGALAYGVLLSSTGQVWFDDLSFEVVDNSVPVTNVENPSSLSKPGNLNFEE